MKKVRVSSENGRLGNTIMKSRAIDWNFFYAKYQPYKGWSDIQGWTGFLRIKQVEYSELLREFYSTIKKVGDEAVIEKWKNCEYGINLDILSEAYRIPNQCLNIAKKIDVAKVKGNSERVFKKKCWGSLKSKKKTRLYLIR